MSATPCEGCGAAINCDEGTGYEYTLTGDPTLPYFFFCPAADCLPPFQGGGGTGGTSGTTPGTPTTPTCGPIFLVCCSHQITRQVCSNTTDAQLAVILQAMLTECQQYAGECSDPPTGPGTGGGTPIDPTQWFFSAAKTCTVTCPDGTAFIGTARAGAFIARTQAQADAQAQAYACSQANNLKRCDGSLDMPLDQAVYVPAVGTRAAFIAGVRGGIAFKFDPVTGAKLAAARVSVPAFGPSSIAYNSDDFLYVSHWNDPAPGTGTVGGTGQRVYQVNPSSLAVVNTYDWGVLGGGTFSGMYNGTHQIIAYNGLIYGWLCGGLSSGAGTSPFFNICIFAPSGPTLNYGGASTYVGQSGWNGLAVNGTEIWAAAPDGKKLMIFNSSTLGQTDVALGTSVYDLCINGSGQAYLTTKGATIKRVSAAHAVLADLTIPGSNNYILRIRYNSADGLVYVPDQFNNCIYVVNPATDTVSVTKTGFDSPIDCVFTPTKKFAVQHGSQGLKEIV